MSPTLALRAWVAQCGNGVTGRIGLTTVSDDPTGCVGFLDAEDGPTAQRLLDDLHLLLSELYAGFPTCHPIDLAVFRELFAPMRLFTDFSVICMVYRNG